MPLFAQYPCGLADNFPKDYPRRRDVANESYALADKALTTIVSPNSTKTRHNSLRSDPMGFNTAAELHKGQPEICLPRVSADGRDCQFADKT